MSEASEPVEGRDAAANQGLTTAALVRDATPPQQPPSEGRGLDDSRVKTDDAGPSSNDQQPAPLFAAEESGELRGRWDTIQAGFVDEPRRAVEQADSLVAGAMKRLAEMFAEERTKLEGQWDRGDEVSTEELRMALRRYRSFFGRLLSM
jgi:hypothetical protein